MQTQYSVMVISCHSMENSIDGRCCALLQGIADSPQLQLPLRKPRKKISVMIVGNHSAGKSSFINWYIGESIQKTVCISCSSSNGCRIRSRKSRKSNLAAFQNLHVMFSETLVNVKHSRKVPCGASGC